MDNGADGIAGMLARPGVLTRIPDRDPFGGDPTGNSPNMVSATQLHLPALGALPAELAPAITAPRPEALALVRQIRLREQSAVASWLNEHLGEATGVDVVTTLTALTDAVVRTLVERAMRRAGAPEGWRDEVGVFAIGGYGRGEMNPHSDLDLMVVSRGAPPPWLAAAWQELQTLCWDAKFQLGGSQRAIPELEHILTEDFVTATALIEQRPLVAGPGLAGAVAGLLDRFRTAHGRAFLRFKLAERAKRGDPVGAGLFLMEPNLKNNPGCLRDVQLLRNLAFICFGGRTLFGLEELSSLTRADLAEVARANDHLLRLRSLLHFHHQRKQDVLQLPDQVRIAHQMGYGDVSRLRAVEHFMRDHYRQTLAVHQVLELAIARARAKGAFDEAAPPAEVETAEGPRILSRSSARIALLRSRLELDQDFCAIDGFVFAMHERLWNEPDWVARVFSAVRLAQANGLRLSYELQRSIRARLYAITDEVRSDPAIARAFLAVLGDLGKVAGVVTDLHDSGLLGAWLPEFGNLTCLMQFDSWHQYTVDRHTLLALRHLDECARGERSGLPGMGSALAGVVRKDLLALGLLLHDMGKYMGRGHVARGAMMVAQVAHRLRLDTEEEDFLHFLVDRHVALSDASRMRDFHEPAFLRAFAERMGDVPRLDALYVLTYCDAKAVGEGVLTGWQEAILGELYTTVRGHLLSGGARAVSHHDRLHAELTAAGIPPDSAEAFLRRFPGTYIHQVPVGEVALHRAVLSEAAERGVGMARSVADRHIAFTAAVADRHGLLADVAATLSGHGLDIVAARSWITADGMVIYQMRLHPVPSLAVRDAEVWDRLRADLDQVAAGRLDTRRLLERRRSMFADRPADSGFDDPAVKIEQRTSETHTILDVHTKDQPGLLSLLCRTISEAGCDIGTACINTMGDVAVDVFYVSKGGAKLTDAAAEDLRGRIIAALQLPSEPAVRTVAGTVRF